MSATLTCAEPFAGAGGLAIGLIHAGFKCVYATDKEPEAVETLAQSVEAVDCVTHSRATVGPFARAVLSRTPTLDLLAAGVPCQPFSSPGLNLGQLDPRDCFPHFTAMAKELRPRAIMIENVSGLVSEKHRTYFDAVLAELRETYAVDHRVLCAADYGVPQARQRVVVVGFLDPAAAARFTWPEPTHGEAELGHAKWVTGTYWDERGLLRQDGRGYKTNEFQKAFLGLQNQSVDGLGRSRRCAGGVNQGFGMTYLFNADRPSPTIVTRRPFVAAFLGDPAVRVASMPTELGAPRAGVLPWRTVRDVLSDAEMRAARGKWATSEVIAKLQGFPPELRFAGEPPDVYRQIGNAVPPRLGEVVGLRVARALRG